ncbi:ABC transporter substrate-binding protein [Paenibacillus thalictri]|uniref:Extracellular solute-binding protein n=1 Tax=Paenibacillus thalictri TaxID=2527873 RepID=A0A4Q9DR98_9BACL|nr:extracellular solute-binding protein [Paenibacillus thalictri]TBL79144.1 extracellular solute-binding protein [Paenibacillus thalictri]
MENKRKQRSLRLPALLVALAAAVSVSACTIQSPAEPEKESTKNAGASVTISWGVQKPKKEADESVYNKVISEYMKLNPKVQVKMAYTEYTDDAQWTTWLNSQLLGGAAPDVVATWHVPAMENFRKGLVVDLKPYLDKQNPYDSKQRSWWDSYSTGLINQNMDNTNSAVPSVPLSTVAVKVFYNKSLFAKAGVTTTPKTFGELLAISEKLKTAGVAPFIAPNKSPADNVLNWLHRMFMDQMIESYIPQLDLDKNGLIELNEIVAGTQKGVIDLEKAPWGDSVDLLKTFSKYWYPGYNGIDTQTATDLFIKQEGAMMMQTGNNLKTFIENPDRKFDIGFFSFPYLTKQDAPNAIEKLHEMGGAPQNNFSIPSSAKGEKLDAAVNFLQFLASEKGAALFAEGFWWTPATKDATLPAALNGMYIEGSTSSLRLLAPQTNQKLYQDDTMVGQLFLEGKTTAKEFNSILNKDLKSTVDQLAKQNGWSEANNWGLKK